MCPDYTTDQKHSLNEEYAPYPLCPQLSGKCLCGEPHHWAGNNTDLIWSVLQLVYIYKLKVQQGYMSDASLMQRRWYSDGLGDSVSEEKKVSNLNSKLKPIVSDHVW